jgi:hypothetical protein
VNGVEQRLKTLGTYNDVMAALKEEYKDAKNNHYGTDSD